MAKFEIRRFLIEGVVIVLSILIAFGIDAWWTENLERQEEQELLETLADELRENLASIEIERKYRHAVLDASQALLDASIGQGSVTLDDMDGWLADLTWWSEAEFSMGTMGALINGGQLTRIEDKSIRLKITDLDQLIQRVRLLERQDYEILQQTMWPYLAEHSSMLQISEAISRREKPGIGGWIGGSENQGAISELTDHRDLLRDRRFHAAVTLKKFVQVDALLGYDQLVSEIQGLLQIIESR